MTNSLISRAVCLLLIFAVAVESAPGPLTATNYPAAANTLHINALPAGLSAARFSSALEVKDTAFVQQTAGAQADVQYAGSLDMTWLANGIETQLARIWLGHPTLVHRVRYVLVPFIEQSAFILGSALILTLYPRGLWVTAVAGIYGALHTDHRPAFRVAAGAWAAASMLVHIPLSYYADINTAMLGVAALSIMQAGFRAFPSVRRETNWGVGIVSGAALLVGGFGALFSEVNLSTRWIDGPAWGLVIGIAAGGLIFHLAKRLLRTLRKNASLQPSQTMITRRELFGYLIAAFAGGRLEQFLAYRQKESRTRRRFLEAATNAAARLERNPEIYALAGVSSEQAQEHLKLLRSLAPTQLRAYRESHVRHRGIAFIHGEDPDFIQYDIDMVDLFDTPMLESTLVHETLHKITVQQHQRRAIAKALEKSAALSAYNVKRGMALNTDMEVSSELLEDAYEDDRLSGDVASAYERNAKGQPRVVARHFLGRAKERRANAQRSALDRRVAQLTILITREPGMREILIGIYEHERQSGQTKATTLDDWIRSWIMDPAYLEIKPSDLRGSRRIDKLIQSAAFPWTLLLQRSHARTGRMKQVHTAA